LDGFGIGLAAWAKATAILSSIPRALPPISRDLPPIGGVLSRIGRVLSSVGEVLTAVVDVHVAAGLIGVEITAACVASGILTLAAALRSTPVPTAAGRTELLTEFLRLLLIGVAQTLELGLLRLLQLEFFLNGGVGREAQ